VWESNPRTISEQTSIQPLRQIDRQINCSSILRDIEHKQVGAPIAFIYRMKYVYYKMKNVNILCMTCNLSDMQCR
jgi:hypothetical protein